MRHSRYVLGVASLFAIPLSLVAGLEIQLALAAPTVGISVGRVAPTPINRHLKGDRLPVIPGQRGETPAKEPSLPAGCELRFSSVQNAYKNEVAGRCVAAAPDRSERSEASA